MSIFDFNLKHIAQGWANLVWPSEGVKEMAEKRANICAQNTCGHLAFMMSDKKRGAYCSKCTCPIAAKVRARGERCPEGLWEQEFKT